MLQLILIIDAVINFVLGVMLLSFSPALVSLLGVPPSSTSFYPNILGAVFIGITIALVVEAAGKKSHRITGLGLLGAISINLCGGIVLALWLLSGRLALPAKGMVFLWGLVTVLVTVSVTELLHYGHTRKGTAGDGEGGTGGK